jgi:flagellar biosynthesis GTPase FlhF
MTDSTQHPSMKDTWSDVGESFSSLGKLMRERYRTAGAADEAADETAAETAAESAEAAAKDEAALRRAFEQVTTAVKDLGERVAEVARDDDVKAQARRTASSFDEALTTTIDMITDQVSGLIAKSRRPPADESTEPSPPSTRSNGESTPPNGSTGTPPV